VTGLQKVWFKGRLRRFELTMPLIVRLSGTNVDEGREIIFKKWSPDHNGGNIS
jgi:hypothetical protein